MKLLLIPLMKKIVNLEHISRKTATTTKFPALVVLVLSVGFYVYLIW